MEPMTKCTDCGGWIRSVSKSDCTCIPQKQYLQGKEMTLLGYDEGKDLFLDRPAQNEVHGPRKVQLYKTNRKQRRAQQAYNRKHKKDKPL